LPQGVFPVNPKKNKEKFHN